MNYLQRISRVLAISIVANLFSCSVIGTESKTATTVDLPTKSHIQERLLFIGDSHSVGVFGRTLTALLQQDFPVVAITAVASCGSEPRWWLEGKVTNCGLWTHEPNGFENKVLKGNTPKLDGLLNELKPKTTIVALGSNLVLMSKEDRETYTEKIMVMLENKGGQCIWISAPDSRKFKASDIDDVYELLKKLSKLHHCKLIDSRKYTKYPTSGGDGLHYGGKEGTLIATQWAEKVFKGIKPALSKSFGLTHSSH
jgi:hypothetical protein